MSRPGVNLAITSDGGTYNKLHRPDDLVAALISQSPPNEPVPAMPSAANTNKRKLGATDVGDSTSDDEHESKRPKDVRTFEAALPTAKPIPADPRRVKRPVRDCGMQSMFPGLDGEESFDEATMSEEDTMEALAYLRSVRSEASTIPTLLVATPKLAEDEPDRSWYSSGRDDHRAVYNDGTWVALDPDVEKYSEDYWSETAEELDVQEQYYNSLLWRYQTLRATLAKLDPAKMGVSAATNASQTTKHRTPSSKKDWITTLHRDFPTPVRVAHLDQQDVFRALQYCAETLDRHETISKQKSCWIWTLLALASEKGTLDYYRAGKIRDLGHKAGQLSVLLHSGARPKPPSDDEPEDIEDWQADEENMDDEDETQPASNEPLDASQDDLQQMQPKAEDHVHQEEVIGPDIHDVGAQVDGIDEREAQLHLRTSQKIDESDHSAEMSMSEDEGEIQEEGAEEKNGSSSELQEARARLLAQLGDRFVQPTVPFPKGQKQSSHSNNTNTIRQGPRHRHNGKVCHDPTCRRAVRSHNDGNNGDTSRTEQPIEHSPKYTPLPGKVYASRAEAEAQRQKIREEVLAKAQSSEGKGSVGVLLTSTSISGKPQEVSNSTSQKDERPKSQGGAGNGASNASIEDSKSEGKESADLNTRVTIDMILTVVAECYGQRDLLRYREVW